MCIILICVGLHLLNTHSSAAQQAYALRDPRMRHHGIEYANRRQPLDVNNGQTAIFNATTLLKQLPAHGFSANLNERQYQPLHTTSQRSTPPEVAKYRNFGNYFQVVPLNTKLTMLAPPASKTLRERREHKPQIAYSTPVSFNHHVLHRERAPLANSRPRRYTNVSSSATRQQDELQSMNELDSKAWETQTATFDSQPALVDNVRDAQQYDEEYPKLIKKTQSFHDIYLRLKPPHQVSFGHVEFKPHKHFEKRFESLNENDGNRHRGEIIWADATGGYGEHYWDLTQGKLR